MPLALAWRPSILQSTNPTDQGASKNVPVQNAPDRHQRHIKKAERCVQQGIAMHASTTFGSMSMIRWRQCCSNLSSLSNTALATHDLGYYYWTGDNKHDDPTPTAGSSYV